MKKIKIADMTLCRENNTFSFKEKIEIARQLDNLNVDVVEIPAVENIKTDTLLVRTISSFVKRSVLSVCTGMTVDGVENAAAALTAAANPRLCVSLPVSPVGMEYTCHKKAPKMLELIRQLVSAACDKCDDVEFCAVDATRAEEAFLIDAVKTAVESGAKSITVCDSAAEIMPDEFAALLDNIITKAGIPENVSVGVMCSNKNSLASASAVLAVKGAADTVNTAVCGEITDLESFSGLIKNCGNTCGFSSGIKYTELNRIIKQIKWITSNNDEKTTVKISTSDGNGINLDIDDDCAAVITAVGKLGYDLSEEDAAKVYEEFRRVAEKKNVGAKELEAIVASTALQVPPTYKLVSYVINTGNILSSSAQIKLLKDGKEIEGVCIGDGPVDASFLAIEQITGHHYELDDFQIQSVTEGKEAMGAALVKLRNGGKLYSGNGISTDIIGAAIRSYISALNKIVYEEV